MYFRLPQIQVQVIPFSRSIGQVKNTCFSLKSNTQPKPKIIVVHFLCETVIPRITEISESKKIRIEPDQKTVFQC